LSCKKEIKGGTSVAARSSLRGDLQIPQYDWQRSWQGNTGLRRDQLPEGLKGHLGLGCFRCFLWMQFTPDELLCTSDEFAILLKARLQVSVYARRPTGKFSNSRQRASPLRSWAERRHRAPLPPPQASLHLHDDSPSSLLCNAPSTIRQHETHSANWRPRHSKASADATNEQHCPVEQLCLQNRQRTSHGRTPQR